VDCSGRLVFGEESASLRDMVKKLIDQSPKVVMNMHEVNHIDSAAWERWCRSSLRRATPAAR